MEYPKIQTVFKRDANNIIIPTEFTRPEFEWLKDCKFRAEEKIDGTNIRIELYFDENGLCHIWFKGRTDKAVIPSHLMDKLKLLFGGINFVEIFNSPKDLYVTLYGEGYGCKIQGCGGRYIQKDCGFILFDVKVGNYWLSRENVCDIATKCGIDVVPQLGYMTIMEAIKFVNDGFKSLVAEDKTLDAEGLVLKTPDNLLMRNGERVILKIKGKDFRQFKQKYGEDKIIFTEIGDKLVLTTTVEQPINPQYETD
jgi:ATP-dependent RNA circularization protein (DNA/RNA ligase family)